MQEVASVLVFGSFVIGGMALVAMMIRSRQRMQELAVQERIALIERGLVPSPETDPVQFDRLMTPRRTMNPRAVRYQSLGIIIMGLGTALAVLLAFAANIPRVAMGVGGAFAILGLAIFLNGSLVSGDPPAEPKRRELPRSDA
jgi:hypothetical protein